MNFRTIRSAIRVVTVLTIWCGTLSFGVAFAADFQIEITKKGLGKEVLLRRGVKEWFMLVEVTPENTVVIRQEKENESYLVDESETHDRSLTATEVDTVIDDFINSVKTQTKLQHK
jgi:hypothetical protein